MTKNPFFRIGKPSFEREGLVGEIGLILLGISAVLVGLTAAFTLGANKQNEIRSVRTYGKQVCRVLASAAATPLADEDMEALATLVQSLAARQGLIYAAVSDARGNVLVESNHADFSGQIPIFSLKTPGGRGRNRVIRDEDSEMVSISQPVFSGERQLGMAQVVVARTGSSVPPQEFGRFVGIVALVSFLLVGAAYGYLRLVLRPLPKLIKELSRQTHDKCIRTIRFKGRGQLEELINAWNEAVDVIHGMIHEVDRSNAQLEIEKHVLEYEKKRIESIIDHLPIGVLVTNASGKIIIANLTAKNLLGRPETQLVGASLGNALGHEHLDKLAATTSRSLELSLGDAGRERIVKVHVTDISTAGDRTAGSVVTLREITQQKLVDRMTSEFVNHVAHEFRTPLASIRAYAEMLVDDQVEDERTRFEFYNTIGQETERLTKLIENLLNISKMEAGSLMANRLPVRIDKLMSETVRGLEPQAAAKGLTLRVEVPEPAPPMELDKDLVSVSLVNLIGNAIKYTPEGGTVEIVGKTEENSLTIRVRDTGPGIQEADFLHIFEKFYRSNDESIQKQPGSGLGLALAQQIAFIHGGEITVTSEPGRGSEFCLALPVLAGKQVPVELGVGS